MIDLKVFVYEYAVGGGLFQEALSTSLMCEGYSMLNSVLLDFKKAGFETSTIVDSKLAKLHPPLPADKIAVVSSPHEANSMLMRLAGESHSALVIAPENNRILTKLVMKIEFYEDTLCLNSTIDSISETSKKMALNRNLEKKGFETPKTRCLNIGSTLNEVYTAVSSLGFPVVFKPDEGLGCSGISLVTRDDQIPLAVEKMRRETSTNKLLIQEMIQGVAASVSLISNGREASPVSLNLQKIVLVSPESNSSYIGGVIPYNHPLKEEALEAARLSVESFRGLKGYVGVDLVMTEEHPVILEVNPRITTSYIGLRRITDFNMAQAMMNSVSRGELPKDTRETGFVSFSKIRCQPPDPNTYDKICCINGIEAPPFPISDEAYAMVLAQGRTLEDACRIFQEKKRQLANLVRCY